MVGESLNLFLCDRNTRRYLCVEKKTVNYPPGILQFSNASQPIPSSFRSSAFLPRLHILPVTLCPNLLPPHSPHKQHDARRQPRRQVKTMIDRQTICRHHIRHLILRYYITICRCAGLDHQLRIYCWRICSQSGFEFRGEDCRCESKTECSAEVLEKYHEGLCDDDFGPGEVVLDGYYDLRFVSGRAGGDRGGDRGEDSKYHLHR